MQFKSEKERLDHPYAKLIPIALWKDVDFFQRELTESNMYFFTNPIELSLSKQHIHLNKRQKKCALIIFLILNPNLKPNQLLTFADMHPRITKQQLFQCAAALGLVGFLESMQTKHNSEYTIKQKIMADDYCAFRIAAENCHLDTMKWLVAQAPGELEEMIDANCYEAFRDATANGRLDIMEWLVSQAPDKLMWMIKANFYAAFSLAAINGHLEVLQWLAAKAPNELEAMIKVDNYWAFHGAAENGHRSTVVWLFFNSANCFAFAESHVQEYGIKCVNPFIRTCVTELHEKAKAFHLKHPNEVFDPTHGKYTSLWFYMMRNIIRRNNRDLDNALHFLLHIPSVRAVVHQAVTPNQQNELLRLALNIGNTQATNMLLAIDAVRNLAAQNDFYLAEQRGGIDLRTLAQDDESSMIGLSINEQKRLGRVINEYKSVVKDIGVVNLMNDLKIMLLERYKQHPAIIAICEKDTELPSSWKDFQSLGLSKKHQEESIKAYSKHPDHTAWRYLSKPNPWMSPEAAYSVVNPHNHEEHWSTFEEYQFLIIILWLAAMDKKNKPTEGHTLEGRIGNFIQELALIGRAHNWDKTRLMNDGETQEEYDDEELDKPSCFSGAKKRLFQSVVGHPLLIILTQEILKHELRDFVCAHFDAVIKKNPESKEKFLVAFNKSAIYLDYEKVVDLKPLNLSEEQQKELLTQLKNKYGEQFSEDLKYINYIKGQLSLTDGEKDPLKAYHALKLDEITHYFSDLSSKQQVNSEVKASEIGLFSNSIKSNQVKESLQEEQVNVVPM